VNTNRRADVERVCRAAQSRSPEARPAFLAEACRGDPELRRQVEALLAEEALTGSAAREEASEAATLTSDPGSEPTGGADAAGHMRLSPGAQLGPYLLEALIGAGGMGEVYKARDTRLGRTVAIKVLPIDLAEDPERRRRFEHEARAASSLNHPNICTIHDIGRDGSIDYLVMEFLPGDTLHERLKKGPLPLDQALAIAEQVADALAAAHRQGIVHRDLKPANIILTRPGTLRHDSPHAKLLDFGLAKLKQSVVTTRPSKSALTAEGTILGTLQYMAPEQLEGRAADARTDLWAMGVTLYEMLTGRPAFEGGSRASLIARIMSAEPAPLTVLQPLTPPALERLVQQCLAKNPDDRPDTAHDVASELRRMRESSAEGHVIAPGARSAPSRRRMGRLILGATVVSAVSLIALVRFTGGPWPWDWLSAGRTAAKTGLTTPTWALPTKVTAAAGWETDPAISGDGGLIAYTSNQSGNSDVWVVPSGGGNAVNVTANEAIDEKPAWFPGQAALAFASDRSGTWDIWQAPPLGGGASLLVPNARDPALSPDGKQIAFVRPDSSGNPRVFVAPVDDLSRARLATEAPARLSEPEQDPAWSPDGRSLCYASYRSLWVVAAAGGPARRLTVDNEHDFEPAWSRNGRIYFSSLRGGNYALWSIPVSGGVPERVTGGAGPERHPSISQDGTRIAFSNLKEDSDLVLHDLITGEEQVTGTTSDEAGPAFSPDRTALVYVCQSKRGGGTELWKQPLLGGRPVGAAVRLAEQPGSVSQPSYSRDGRWLVYQRVVDRNLDICTLPAGGGAPTILVGSVADEVHPAWSPTGDAVVFASQAGGAFHIWRVAVKDGQAAGPARQVTFEQGNQEFPAWSPDGRRIAYIALSASVPEVWITQSDGAGQARKVSSGAGASWVRWHPLGLGIIVNGSWGARSLSLRLLDPDSQAITAFRPPVLIGEPARGETFDVSLDGRSVAFSRVSRTGDVWVTDLRR
jgi:eukaryotic-like serine/threonine-protein kinase